MHASNSEACPNARHHLLAISSPTPSSSSNTEIFSMIQRNIPKTTPKILSVLETLLYQLSYRDQQEDGTKARASTPSYRIFARCNIFDIVAIVRRRHRMFICPKIRLSQPIEMCTQFTSAQMLHTLNTAEKYSLCSGEIFITQQRNIFFAAEKYSQHNTKI